MMSEQEIIQSQQDGRRHYLLLVGMFYHAYEGAAFALGRITGYRIRKVHRKQGDVRVLGFVATQFDRVRVMLADRGIQLHRGDDEGRLWWFEGGDPTPDESMITDASSGKERQKTVNDQPTPHSSAEHDHAIAEAVMHFNVASATPIEALLLISQLQKLYGRYQ